MRFGADFTGINMKLQREINRWIDERGNRGVGHDQVRRNLAERQANLEMLRLDLQVPIFVLEHDGHFVGKALVQMRWDHHTGRLCLECDVEMMVAGQAVQRDIAKHAAYNCAQGLLHDIVIGNQAIGTLITHARLVD